MSFLLASHEPQCYYDDVVRAPRGSHEALMNPIERLIYQAFASARGVERDGRQTSLCLRSPVGGTAVF